MPRSPLLPKSLPKKAAIYHSLVEKIEDGTFAVGEYLPSTRMLADGFRTSVTPVNAALDDLRKAGYIEPIHGSGVRVTARTHGEAAVRRKPVVEILSSLTDSRLGALPSEKLRHSLPAVQEWLLWSLSQHEHLRVRVAHVWPDQLARQLAAVLDDLLVYRPNVFAFSFPEDVSEEMLAALEKARARGVHVVYRASRCDLPRFDRVYSDFRQGQRDLTGHLLARGCRHILRLRADRNLLYEQQKQAGFCEALSGAGVAGDEAERLTVECHLDEIAPDRRVEQVIGILHKQLAVRPIDAISAHNDRQVGVVRVALRWLGRPDIVVAGYDDDWDEQLARTREDFGDEAAAQPAPLTVDTCLPEVGQAMAELVLGRASGTLPDTPRHRTVPQRLIVPA